MSNILQQKPTGKMQCQLLNVIHMIELTDLVSKFAYESGFKPDMIIAIARGGLVPARFIADNLGISTIVTMTVRHYGAGAAKNERAYVAHPINVDISEQKVLVIDDVNDTGDTFEAAIPHIQEKAPSEIRTAVLHEKETSSFRANFVGETLSKWRWLIYPWAAIEDLSSFVRELIPTSENRQVLQRRLRENYGLKIDSRRLDQIFRLIGDQGARFLN